MSTNFRVKATVYYRDRLTNLRRQKSFYVVPGSIPNTVIKDFLRITGENINTYIIKVKVGFKIYEWNDFASEA